MKKLSLWTFFLFLSLGLTVSMELSSGQAQTVLLETGWEDGQSQGIADRVLYSKDVVGYSNSSSPPPECSRRRGETLHSGSYSLLIAGYSKAAYAYCYYQAFEMNIPVTSGTKIGYWIYHVQGTPQIAVDGRFTDGNTIRDFGDGILKDQNGVRIHPAARKDPMNQWVYVEVDLSPAAGKTLGTLMFAFDNGNNGYIGPYRAYVDDLKIFTGSSGNCQANVPADRWKGEYFDNPSLSGSPKMVRDDGADSLSFDWGGGSPSSSCGIPSDNFSVRWTRTVNFASGNYKFTITADDGVRVWAGDRLILDKWIDQAPTTYTVENVVLSGSQTIKMEYYEKGGGATAKLSWANQGGGTCQASVSADRWKGEYFNNMTLSGSPVLVRDDGNEFLNFDWGTGSPGTSCGVPADNLSARWTRAVNFPGGNYKFTVIADDGVRVWIDNQLQLDKWIDQAPTTYTFGPISLAGNHTIKMEYYERGGGAMAKLSWQGVANPCQASVPADRWKGEYFNNLGLAGTPVMVRDDGNGFVSFDWGEGSPSPVCGVPVDNFSARFTRTVNFIQGSYQFTVTADDGVRVWIDDQVKLDKWIDQAPTTYTFGPIDLTGNHTIKMEYYERGGGAVAKLSWATIASGGLEWPNSVSFANSDPWLAEHHQEIRRMRPRVLALNFVNQKSMDQMRAHMQQAIAAIAEGSRYHGYKDANAPVFIQYELAYAIDLRDPVPPPNFPYHNSSLYPRENPVIGWGLDYGKLFSPEFAQLYRIPDPNNSSRFLTLCELIERGLVHEVWIYGDQDVPDVSAAEVLELKPYYDGNRQRIPGAMNPCAGNGCFDGEDVTQMNCSRTVRIAWMNNTRGAGCFLESLSHGMESFSAWNRNQIPYLSRYFVPFAGYDLNTKYGLPVDSWYACSGSNCLQYPTPTSVAYDLHNGVQGMINPYDPVCGNVHFPPNGRSHYDLESPYTVRTSCGHYRDGSGQTDEFTIQAFAPYNSVAGDCDGPFLVWWRQNMPGLDNTARDDQRNPMLNWWPFLFY